MAGTAPRYRQSKFWLDLGERIAWTGVQAGLGIVTVVQFDLPEVYVPIVAAVLAAVKGFVARKVSPEKDSASTAPGV